MFINFSNHPTKYWTDIQIAEALKYGEITDIPFPAVEACDGEEKIQLLAKEYTKKIIELKPDCVMCQGEFSLSYEVIKNLRKYNITVVAACSKRKTTAVTNHDGTTKKTSLFQFIKFRKYS